MTPLRLLAFAASVRRGSWNRKLVELAAGLAREAGAEVDLAEFREFDMPLYDADLQASSGIPAGALELSRRLGAAHGFLLASPEYNFSLPGTIKNAIDWVSRIRPVPFRGKSAMLLAASNSQVGGIRGSRSSEFRWRASASSSIRTCMRCPGPTRRSARPAGSSRRSGRPGWRGWFGAT